VIRVTEISEAHERLEENACFGERPRLTIVVPCFNEARRLSGDTFLAFADAHPWLRFVFVDDGSTDATQSILQKLARRAPHCVSVLPLLSNHGKAEAVRQGCLHALQSKPLYFGYWDADLATPLEEIPRFIQILDHHPSILLVIGSRVRLLGRSIRRSWVRHYLGRVFATCASGVLGLPIYDTQCGAKVFRFTPTTASVFQNAFISRWLVDLEIIRRLRGTSVGAGCHFGDALYELPLDTWNEVAGSKLSLLQAIGAAYDLCRIALTPSAP
jgi:dolichyl-phosphate beta-glucosyltransferase